MYLTLFSVSYVQRDRRTAGLIGHIHLTITLFREAHIIFVLRGLIISTPEVAVGRGTYSQDFPGGGVECSASNLLLHVLCKLFDCVFGIIRGSAEEVGVFLWTQFYWRIERHK